jgi:hypothetical protein
MGSLDSWLAGFLFRRFLPRLLRPNAFAVELQDDGVMHQAVNGRHSGHWVLEDLVPFGEHQIAADHHAAPLISLGQKREQHFHLGAVLLHITQIVQDDDCVAVQLF